MAQNQSLNDYGDVLQPADVQAILHVSRSTVRNLLLDGSLDYFKVGCYYRIPKDSLIQFISKTNTASKTNAAQNWDA